MSWFRRKSPPRRPAPPPATPRSPAVDPADLARYFRAALDFVDFRELAKAGGAETVEIADLALMGAALPGPAAPPPERAPEEVVVALCLRPAGTPGRGAASGGAILAAIPALRQDGAGLLAKPGEVPVFNPRHLGPAEQDFCLADGARLQDCLSARLGLAATSGDPAAATPWPDWLEGTLRAAAEAAAGSAEGPLPELIETLSGTLDRRRRETARLGRRKGAGQSERRDPAPWRLVAAIHRAAIGSASTAPVAAVYDVISRHRDAVKDDLALFDRLARPEPARLYAGSTALDRLVTGNIDEHAPNEKERPLYPLDPTQGAAVRAVLDLAPGETVSINGPPGSGKTSMLRAVIASSWVSAALERAPCPIVVATGFTQQSVTNVIGAFGDAPHRDGSFPLARRWLPGLSSYGAFFPALSSQNDEGIREFRNVTCLGRAGHGRSLLRYLRGTDLLDPETLEEAEAHWLAQAETVAAEGMDPAPASIEEGREAAWEQLREVAETRTAATRRAFAARGDPALARHLGKRRQIWSAERIARVEAFLALAAEGGAGLTRDEQRAEIEAVLDITWRAEAFYWAAHYWEAEFLVSARTRLVSRHPLNAEEALRRAAMLTPCIVSTLHTLPRLGEIDPRTLPPDDPRRTLLGLFDLVIIDEAGQAPPELAGAAFALAKRAAVVGDLRQLAPIASIDSLAELALLRREGLTGALDALALTGKSAASGSALAMARHASSVTDGAEPGITLLYHYRCAPAIIGYCNALCYHGRLRPITKDRPGAALPHMSWVEVAAEPDSAGGSKRSTAEAEEIASWLAASWPRWQAGPYKGKKIAEIVAVLSAYRAQAGTIRSAILRAFDAARDGEGWPEEADLNAITIGTVHRLQGAERPVVCFSVTEGAGQAGSSFVDREPALMNVAVSRAKAAFVTFANPARLFPPAGADGPLAPIHLLGRYLKAHGERLYPKRLVIIEAGAKRATLEAILGKAARVEATLGAVSGPAIGGVDIEAGFRARRLLRDGAEPRLAAIRAAAADMEEVVLATDDDRMGELIAWDVARLAGLEGARRVRLGALTRRPVEAAMAAPGKTDSDAVAAELVREIADALISARLSAAMETPPGAGLPEQIAAAQRDLLQVRAALPGAPGALPRGMGRVQAAVLRLLLDAGRDTAAAAGQSRIRIALPQGDGAYLMGNAVFADGRTTCPPAEADAIARALEETGLLPEGLPETAELEAARPQASTYAILAAAARLGNLLPWQAMAALQGFYDGSWGSGEAAREDPLDPIEPPESISGHPPVTPLDAAATPGQLAPVMSAAEALVYRIVWGFHALRGAGSWRQVHAAQRARPAAAHPALPPGLQVVFEATATEGAEDEVADPELRQVLSGQTPGEHADLPVWVRDAWTGLPGAAIRAATRPARDWEMDLARLLELCEARGIGRPSTIGRALEALIETKALVAVEETGRTHRLRLSPTGLAAALALEAREPALSDPAFSARLQALCARVEEAGGAPAEAFAGMIGDLAPGLGPEARAAALARCWRHPGESVAAPGRDRRAAGPLTSRADGGGGAA